MRRLAAALAALVALATTAGIASAGPGRCDVAAGRGWSSAPLPAFPHRPDRPAPLYTAPHATDIATAGGRVWVTDGYTVFVTPDGGCTWRKAYALPERGTEPAMNATSVINELAVSDGTLLALVEGALQGSVPTLTVLRITSAGATTATGLPRLAQPVYDQSGIDRRLIVSGRTVYLIACSPGTSSSCTTPTVYASRDGGRTFAARGEVPHAGSTYAGTLAIDPRDAQRLWVTDATPSTLYSSRDGGVTWQSGPVVLHGLHDLQAVALPRGLRLLARDSRGEALRASDDGGRTWRVLNTPAGAHWLTPVPGAAVALVGGDDAATKVISWQPSKRPLDLTPRGGLHLEELKTDGRSLWVRTQDRLLRRPLIPAAATTVGAPAGRDRTAPGSPPTGSSPTLAPAALDVIVPAGSSRRLPLRLTLPSRPGAAEVGLLLDATGSMEAADRSLAAAFGAVTHQLAPDTRYAVATFGEYALRQYGGDAPEYNIPYERLTDFVPAGPALWEALGRIRNNGGSTDTLSSALPALQQALTGAGQDVDDPGALPTADIPPGQQMSFRRPGLRVVLLATDTEAHQPPGYPGPPLASVVAELRRRNVLLVGLDVAGGPVRGTRFLTALARGSGANAPATGVDCDADGTPDVAAGAPLVCPLGALVPPPDLGRGLATAITALLDALPQPERLAFTHDHPAGHDEVRVVLPDPVTVDVHRRSLTRDVNVDVRCPAKATTARFTVTATLSDRPMTSSAVTVRCVAPSAMPGLVAAPPPTRTTSVGLVGAPVPAAAAAPPAPPASGSQLVPQTGPAPAPLGAAAVDPAEERAIQLAVAEARTDTEQQAAMSLLATSAVALAGATLLARRTSAEPARH